MALETATYIDGLVATNPAASDAINTADDHLRLIKSTVKATFPNINAAVTKTAAEINDALEKSGGTMTGPLTLAGAPTENLQAATKAYVDSALGGVDSGVVSFSAGSTGLTPSSATGGVVTLGGTLAVTNGGTGSTTAAGARSNLAVPSTTGSGASGTWGISISGNAATATSATSSSTATTANSLASGATLTASQVGSGTAALSVGAVGSYAFLASTTSATLPGSTVAGSSLRYAGALVTGTTGGSSNGYRVWTAPSGTWRCMGYSGFQSESEGDNLYGMTLWLRIS